MPADIGRPLTIKYLFILFWNSQTIRWLVAWTVDVEKTKREKRYAPENWSRTDSLSAIRTLSAIRASVMKLYSNIHCTYIHETVYELWYSVDHKSLLVSCFQSYTVQPSAQFNTCNNISSAINCGINLYFTSIRIELRN